MGNGCYLKDERCGTKCTFERCIIGESPKLHKVMDLIHDVTCTDTTILLLGESGTGKELLAQAIHYNSHRSSAQFVAVNCAAFPDNLLESELFGYERGAFTGAEITKPGRFELAQGGTLFLDEIGDMSLPVQAKFLRVLEEREFMRLGGTVSVKSNIRIISATNKDLSHLIDQGKFRKDLLYRINVFPITLPPLRERKEDIPSLVDNFIRKFGLKMGKQVNGISQKAMTCLSDYDWIGNIRELQNAIERAVILCQNNHISEDNLPLYITTYQKTNIPLSDDFVIPSNGFFLDELEEHIIIQALERCDNNKTKAAQLIGLSRSKFRYRLKKHHLCH